MTKQQVQRVIKTIEAEHGVKSGSARRIDRADGSTQIIRNGAVIITITRGGGVVYH